MNIVIVDNDTAILRSLTLVLGQEGHRVASFSDPRRALIHFVRRHPVDVLLVDYAMPEMNGDELLHLLKRKIPGTCRIVMMSAHRGLRWNLDTEKLGIHAFLEKPIELAALKQALSASIATPPSLTTNQRK